MLQVNINKEKRNKTKEYNKHTKIIQVLTDPFKSSLHSFEKEIRKKQKEKREHCMNDSQFAITIQSKVYLNSFYF